MKQKQTILLFNPMVAKDIGLNESIVLQQLNYWQSKYDAQKWIYNTYEEWQRQFPFWSINTIRRTFSSLKEQGLIQIKRARDHNLYRLCFEKVKKFFSISNCPTRALKLPNLDSSYIYTKTTTKTNAHSIERPEAKITKEEKEENIQKEEGVFNPLNPRFEDETAKHLVVSWEANIPSKGKGIVLTKSREERLKVVFCEHFNSDLKQWVAFVSTITKSKFLMGEVTGFRISLDWAIREENLLKIQEGNYLAKDEIEIVKAEKRASETISELENKSTSDSRWKNMLQSLLRRFGQDTYISWFSKMELDSEEDGILRIKTPSKFIKEWIDTYYGGVLHSIGERYFNGMRRVCFVENQTQKVRWQ